MVLTNLGMNSPMDWLEKARRNAQMLELAAKTMPAAQVQQMEQRMSRGLSDAIQASMQGQLKQSDLNRLSPTGEKLIPRSPQSLWQGDPNADIQRPSSINPNLMSGRMPSDLWNPERSVDLSGGGSWPAKRYYDQLPEQKDQARVPRQKLYPDDRLPLDPMTSPPGSMLAENWVRPGPQPQPMPQTDFYEPPGTYGPEEGYTPPETDVAEAPPYTTDRQPRVRPPESSLKFQDRPGDVQSKPPGVGEWFDKVTGRGGGGGLLEQFTTNKTDKGPPSQIAQGIGNALGLGGDAVQKGAGLFGKLLSGISLLSSMQAPPPPPPQQEPSPDFAAAYQQQRRQAEEEPPPEPPSPQAQAVMTPQQIAEIKRKRQRLGLADLLT